MLWRGYGHVSIIMNISKHFVVFKTNSSPFAVSTDLRFRVSEVQLWMLINSPAIEKGHDPDDLWQTERNFMEIRFAYFRNHFFI